MFYFSLCKFKAPSVLYNGKFLYIHFVKQIEVLSQDLRVLGYCYNNFSLIPILRDLEVSINRRNFPVLLPNRLISALVLGHTEKSCIPL